jgi:ketosteroid isomerase-like protein
MYLFIYHSAMKKIINILLVATIAIAVTSCKKSGPENVAKDFVMALDSKDYDKAKSFGTEDTKAMVDLIKNLAGMTPATDKHAKIDKMDCKVDGDKGVCTYCCTAEGQDDKVDVVRKDGKWLVDMKKNPGGNDLSPKSDTTATDEPAPDAPAPAAGEKK